MQAGDIIHERYRLEAPLGAGGIGVVWTATQLGLDRRVAIKFLKTMAVADRERFALEAKVLGQIDHPNCVAVYDYGHMEGGEPFLVMELLDGRSLSDLRGQVVPWPTVVAIARQVVGALTYAHERGVTHRDLKPENVMLVGADAVKVVDFGLAKLAGREQPDITKAGEILGTPTYMSPEQLRGRNIGPLSDLYSLGVMLFELIEGHAPFAGATFMEIGTAHLGQPAPPISRFDCPAALREIVRRLLEKDPAARFADARQLAIALDRVGEAPTNLPTRRESDEVTFSRTSVWIVSSVFVGLTGMVAVLLMRDPERVIVPIPPTAARVAVAPPTPPRPASPVDVGVVDTSGAPDATVPPARPRRSPGCGEQPPFSGRGDIQSSTRVLTVLPPKYDKDRAYPLVVLLHEKTQTPENMLDDTAFEALARREGFIVAVPEMHLVYAWDSASDYDDLANSLERLQSSLCIDPHRIFALGHANGGRAAERVACEVPGTFAGIATSSYRSEPDTKWCKRPTPNLHLAPLHDAYNPSMGGRSCSGAMKLSLDEHETQWLEINGCEGERRSTSKHKSSECFDWDCETPFVSCHLDGGHNWPDAKSRPLNALQSMVSGKDCDGTPADFPYGETVWRFFESLSDGDPER